MVFAAPSYDESIGDILASDTLDARNPVGTIKRNY